ncbi:MAG: M1 family aminopeptidase, partial [Ignavibacteriaceae bacterium]
SCFILNKDMEINNIFADGISVSFDKKDSDGIPNSAEFKIESNVPKDLVIEYSGKIMDESFPPVIRNVNMIKPGLVELALYVSWYPRLVHNNSSFNFQMNVDLPSNFITVTNGALKEEKVEIDRRLTEWYSFNPGIDILILAAPDLKESEITKDSTTIEFYYDKLPDSYVDSMKSNLVKSVNWLTNLLGPSKSDRLIRVGYAPRPAWGYVRAPFIIVSEINALYGRNQRFGTARDFRYITHEISHYWWSFANTNSPDDWINEGLAEYSAFLVSENIMGKDFTEQLLKEYNEKADNSSTESAIAETENDSPDREVNRYAKPVLIYNEAEKRFGHENMRRFYRNLYNRFLNSNNVTTEIFLDEVKKVIGSEAYQYFSKSLYKKKWKDELISSENNYINADIVFFGTWHGTLEQMGMKMKMILHIIGKDGKLEAKTDSPDQGVKDIPISEIKINGDSLFFKLGAASAVFEGTLDRKKMIISGLWNQAGSAYPLSLYKNN